MKTVSIDEYKKIVNKNTRESRTICQDDTTTKILQQAMATIQSIQGHCMPEFFDRPIGLSIRITGKTKADKDNIYKGIADGLQGYAFRNDKQIKRGSFE